MSKFTQTEIHHLIALAVLAVPGHLFASPQDTTADAVLGQLSFSVNGANEGAVNASAASLNGNRGLTVDQTSGRLWVCDTGNNRVLSWPSAASFTNHQAADIVLGQADFTSNGDNRGLANPNATTLSGPRSIAVDSAGNVYVADSGNKRILRYAPNPATNATAAQVFGQASSFTTNNQAAANAATADNLGNPDGIAVDSAGNVYLADLFLHRVLIFNTPATTDTTADRVIGQPNLTSAQRNQNDGLPVPAANTLNNPEGVAVDASGNLYVVDQGNNRVLRYSTPITTNQAATIVYGQPSFVIDTAGTTDSKMSVPVAAAIDPVSGNLYVADSINNRVLEFVNPANDSTADRVFGQTLFTTGTPNLGGISATSLLDVGGVTFDAAGNLYAGDRLNNRVLRFNVGTTGGGGGGMNGGVCGLPCGAGFFSVMPMMLLQVVIMKRRMKRKGLTRATNHNSRSKMNRALLAVVLCLSTAAPLLASPENTTADAVLGQASFNANAANEGSANATNASLSGNRGLTVDRVSGRLWVCDTSNNRVLSWPSAASFTNHQSADIVLGQVDFNGAGDNKGNANPSATSLSGPRGVAVDSTGNVYVADSGNKRILRYNPNPGINATAMQVFGQAGSFTTANQAAANAATADNMGNPDGVAVDSLGTVYVADLFLHRVLVFTTPAANNNTTADFVIGQVNLTTAQRNQNDNNPVPAANTLNNPEGVTVDGNNVYVVDQSNNRVLRFAPITQNNQSATHVFGQLNFTSGGAATTSTGMSVPVAAAVDPISGNLYVADSINDRVLEFANPANDNTADRVFGQLDFVTGTQNIGGVSAATLFDVGGVAVDATGNLYAGDRLNSRLLRYNIAPDGDADGVPDSTDNCSSIANANQANADGDVAGDACDGCPSDAAKIVAGLCGCGVADTDTDSDGVPDCLDNCDNTVNADQADADANGVGDACEPTGGGGGGGGGGSGGGGGGGGGTTGGTTNGICGLPCGAGFFQLMPLMMLQGLLIRRRQRRLRLRYARIRQATPEANQPHP